ncbi:MAG: serine hydrolase domain-containing protein [Cyclobacteriaceae bacterium]
MKLPALAISLFLIFCFLGCKNNVGSKYQNAIEKSKQLLDSIRVAQKIPGIDAAIAIDGKIVWSEGFGHADLEQGVKVIPGITRFRIGSVSKPLTSAALGKLIDAGKVDINESVYTYLPDFPKKKYPITVKEISGHIAGIRHYRGSEFLMNERFNSVSSSLSIFKDDSLLFEPGTDYSYSSYGFNLLSAVIEKTSGEAFLPFIQREVFSALDMKDTTPDFNDSIIYNRTSFYELNSESRVINAPTVDNSYKWAGGGFLSTTTDLIKFGEAHMSSGFLSESTLNTFTTSQILANGDSTSYGVGWRTYHHDGFHGYGHTGGSVGGITAFRIYPNEKMVLVLLSNSSDTNYGEAGNKIVNWFLSSSTD